MGIWPFGRKNRPRVVVKPAETPRGRPTKARQAEKRRERLADMRTQLDLARMEIDLKEIQENRERPLDVGTVQRVVRYLRDLGLELVPKGGGRPVDEGGLGRFLHDFLDSETGKAVAQVATGALLGGGAGAQNGAGPAGAIAPSVTVAVEPPTTTSPEQVPPNAPPSNPPSPTIADAHPAGPVDVEQVRLPLPDNFADLEALTQQIVLPLTGKTPAEAAAWLVSEAPTNQVAARVVAEVRASTDEQLFDALEGKVWFIPAAKAAVAWLRAYPGWAHAMAGHVRRTASGAATAQEAGS